MTASTGSGKMRSADDHTSGGLSKQSNDSDVETVDRLHDSWRKAKITLQSDLKKPSRRRRIAVLVVTFLAVVGCLSGLVVWKVARVYSAIAAHSHERPPIEVAAIKVTLSRLPTSIDSIGTLRAIRIVDVAPEVAGRIVSIDFEAGQKIVKETRLLQLDDRLEQAQLKAAVSRASYARLQLERSKALVVTQAESRQTLDQRQSEFDQAQAAVEQLQTQIAYKAIVAPFDGFLGLRQVNLGEYLAVGTKIVSLTALDELYVNFAVPQQELSKLMPGTSVSVRSDAFPGEVFPATITAIEPVVDTNTRNVTVQATMKNPDDQMRPGIFVNVSVALPVRENVVLVPVTAVQATASGDTAFLVKDGKVDVVPVKTGARVGEQIVIEAGLFPGDTIITNGQVRVYPGARVSIASKLATHEQKIEGQ